MVGSIYTTDGSDNIEVATRVICMLVLYRVFAAYNAVEMQIADDMDSTFFCAVMYFAVLKKNNVLQNVPAYKLYQLLIIFILK